MLARQTQFSLLGWQPNNDELHVPRRLEGPPQLACGLTPQSKRTQLGAENERADGEAQWLDGHRVHPQRLRQRGPGLDGNRRPRGTAKRRTPPS